MGPRLILPGQSAIAGDIGVEDHRQFALDAVLDYDRPRTSNTCRDLTGYRPIGLPPGCHAGCHAGCRQRFYASLCLGRQANLRIFTAKIEDREYDC